MSNSRSPRGRGAATLAGRQLGPRAAGTSGPASSTAAMQPSAGEPSVEMLVVVPDSAPAFDGGAADLLNNPDIEEKLDLIRDGSRVSVKAQARGVVELRADNKQHIKKGVAALVQILSRNDPGLLIYHPAHLVQMPSTGRANFLIKRVQHDMENKGGERISVPDKDGVAPTYRFITDRPTPQPEKSDSTKTDTKQDQELEFGIYTAEFMGHLDNIVERMRSSPEEMRMRVNIGALLQYQYPKNLDLTSASGFEKMIGDVMRRATFYYNKDISYLDRSIGPLRFASKVQKAIEVSPDIFSPADSRIETLDDVQDEIIVVVFTKDWRLEMQYQEFTNRSGGQKQYRLVQPTVFRREHKNKEKAIISVNPDGSYDWGLEILVEERLDGMSEFFRNMHRHVELKQTPDKDLRPRLSAQVVQGAKVTGITTKSARTYMIGDATAPYHVEVATYKDWSLTTGACIWQSCSMSFYNVDWVDALNKQNIAFDPRDLCPTKLLPVAYGQPVQEGGTRFLRLIKTLQDFLDRVRSGEFDKPDGDGATPGPGGGAPGKVAGKRMGDKPGCKA